MAGFIDKMNKWNEKFGSYCDQKAAEARANLEKHKKEEQQRREEAEEKKRKAWKEFDERWAEREKDLPKTQSFGSMVKKGLKEGWRWLKLSLVLFFGGMLSVAIPGVCILALPAMVVGVIMAFYAVCVIPFATILHEITEDGKRILEAEERKKAMKEAQEKGVEYVDPKEKAKQDWAVANEKARLYREQKEREAQEKVAEQLTPKNMKVDLGDGKKVAFKDLPAHLQEQLLTEWEKNPQHE